MDETRIEPQPVQAQDASAAGAAPTSGSWRFWSEWSIALCDSADALYSCADRFNADLPRSRAIRESADELHDKSEAYRALAQQLRAKERMTDAAR